MNFRFALLAPLCLAALPVWATSERTVAAVNAPLAYIARTLLGETTEVIYPVPEDVDPAYWRPAPEAVQLYQSADLILLNGAGYAGWTATEVLPRARLVDTTKAVQDRLIPDESKGEVHKHGPEGEHAHDGAFAFTTWLDPEIAAAQVDAVAQAASARWPDLAGDVEARAEGLKAEIAGMDTALAAFFDGLSGRQVFASHPVYQYLDRAYDIGINSLHWEPDADPGEQEWRSVEQALDAERQPVMLWEGEPTPEIRERLDSMGVEQILLSPMGNERDAEQLFEGLAKQVATQL